MGFRRMMAAVLVAGSIVAMVTPGHAEEQLQGTYDATLGTPVAAPVCSPCVVANIGGAIFSPEQLDGLSPIGVSIDDASGTLVGFDVCQDTNGDGFDCSEGDAAYHGCGSGDLSLVEWDVTKDVTVYVHLVGACAGIGTTGVITLTVA